MRDHKVCLHWEIRKITFELSWILSHIWSSVNYPPPPPSSYTCGKNCWKKIYIWKKNHTFSLPKQTTEYQKINIWINILSSFQFRVISVYFCSLVNTVTSNDQQYFWVHFNFELFQYILQPGKYCHQQWPAIFLSSFQFWVISVYFCSLVNTVTSNDCLEYKHNRKFPWDQI